MKLTSRLINKLVKSTILMFTLYSCSFESITNQNTNVQKANNSKNIDFSVKGKVQFDSFKTKGEAEVVRKASVSIIYPSDYSDLSLRNSTLATGITNTQGDFTINPNQNFVPELNKVMILESTRRVNGVGNSLTSLRTHIRWNGTKWDSISTPQNYINAKTTSLALISALDSSVLSPSDSINKLTIQNGVGTISYNSKLTEGIFNWILDLVNSAIYELKDPIQEVYSLAIDRRLAANSFTNKIISNMHTFQTMVETYAVDWGGVYGRSSENIEIEAKNKNYYPTRFKNPFADLDPISKLLPVTINYPDYIQAKNTLTYKGIQLQTKESLKGLIIYDISPNYTQYYLYGVDISGELIKNNNRISSEFFYLTNQ